MVEASITMGVDKLPETKGILTKSLADLLRIGVDAWAAEVVHLAGEPKHGKIYGDHQAAGPGEPWARETGETEDGMFVDKSEIRSSDPHATGGFRGPAATVAAVQEFGRQDGTMPAHPTIIPALEKAKQEMLEHGAETLTYLGSRTSL